MSFFLFYYHLIWKKNKRWFHLEKTNQSKTNKTIPLRLSFFIFSWSIFGYSYVLMESVKKKIVRRFHQIIYKCFLNELYYSQFDIWRTSRCIDVYVHSVIHKTLLPNHINSSVVISDIWFVSATSYYQNG